MNEKAATGKRWDEGIGRNKKTIASSKRCMITLSYTRARSMFDGGDRTSVHRRAPQHNDRPALALAPLDDWVLDGARLRLVDEG